MIKRLVEDVRTGWGPLLDEVIASDDPARPEDHKDVAIVRARGRPADRVEAGEVVAVLVPYGWYSSTPASDRPAEQDVRVMTSSAVRANVAEVMTAVSRGTHTVITQYGKPRAVLVPEGWHQSQQ